MPVAGTGSAPDNGVIDVCARPGGSIDPPGRASRAHYSGVMSSLPELHPMSVEEWIAFEEASPEIRHELVNGHVYAMTGASRRHNLLATNIGFAVRSGAQADGCRMYMNDMKLQIDNHGYYPAVMVVCDPPTNDLIEYRPCLLVEVLSPSTGRIDRNEKRTYYTGLDSLHAYLIAEPDRVRIEVHQRIDGTWREFLAGPGDQIALSCPIVVLDVDDLYRGVE